MKPILNRVLRSPYTYLYIAFAAFYIWLAAQIPYMHDDWGWALPIGLERLVQGNINGRYVGNLFEVIMTRSAVAKTFILSTCYVLIPFLMSHFAVKPQTRDRKAARAVCFVFCNVLLLTINRSTWSETYSWTAGFANFCISAVFIMVWIREITAAFSSVLTAPRTSAIRCFGLGLLCLLTQLFLENIAIYTVILAVYLCAVYAVRLRKIPAKLIAMLSGAVIGLLITFSSSVYGALWSTGTAVGGYRRLLYMHEGDILGVLYALLDQATVLVTKLYEANTVLVLTVLLLLTVLLVKKSSKARPWRIGFIVANLSFASYFLWHLADSHLHRNGTLYADPASGAALLVNVSFFLLVTVEACVLFADKRLLLGKLLTVWISAPAVILPLVVTGESGARLFFTSDVFIILFAVMLFGEIISRSSRRTASCVLGGSLVTVLLFMVFYSSVYADIARFANERQRLIDNALAEHADTITLPSYVHKEFLCNPDPLPDVHMDYFREYHRIPSHVEIVIEE